MGKGNTAKGVKPADKPAKAPAPAKPAADKAPKKTGTGKVSDELRQAIKDLGGDDSDLDLIAGVDNDDAADDFDSASKSAALDEVGGAAAWRRS